MIVELYLIDKLKIDFNKRLIPKWRQILIFFCFSFEVCNRGKEKWLTKISIAYVEGVKGDVVGGGGGAGYERKGRGKKGTGIGERRKGTAFPSFLSDTSPRPPPFNACYYLGKVYSPRRISRNSLFLATRLSWSNIFCHHFLFTPCAPCSGKSKFGPVLIIKGFFFNSQWVFHYARTTTTPRRDFGSQRNPRGR